jgi:hypothetical protein
MKNISWFREIVLSLALSLLIISVSCRPLAQEVYPVFEIVALGVSPQPAAIGEEVTITAQVANVGKIQGTYTAILLVDGTEVDKKDVEIPPKGIEPVTFKIVEDGAETYIVKVGNMSTTLRVLEVRPVFVTTSMNVSPWRQPRIGEEVAITVQIANVSNTEGTYTARLFIDEVEVDKKDVVIPAWGIEPVTFKMVWRGAARGIVRVGDISLNL